MKGFIARAFIMLSILPVALLAQEGGKADKGGRGEEYTLSSENLDKQGKDLDAQIVGFNRKIADVVKKYNLLNTPDIRSLPYQYSYKLGKDFIEMERHLFIKDDIYHSSVVGIKRKRMKIYTDGNTVSKIEMEIAEEYTESGLRTSALIIDPSPLTEGTDDIQFTYMIKGRKFLDNRKLGDIKNTTAFPVRNDMKRDFLIPNLTIFSDALLFVAEGYYKSIKDADINLLEFLKKSTTY